MKMHLAWIRAAAAVTTIATFGGQFAAGQSQYGPYSTTPPYSATQYYAAPSSPTQSRYSDDRYSTQPQSTASIQSPATPTYQTVAPYGVPAASPTATTASSVYPTTDPATYYTAARDAYTFKPAQQTNSLPAKSDNKKSTTSASLAPRYSASAPVASSASSYQPPQYQPAGAQPTYAKLAQQSTGTVTPGVSTPAPQSTGPLPAPANAGVNAAMPYPSTDSFFNGDPMAPGGDGGCNPADYGYGALDGCMDEGCGNQWFGGIYGLYMTRTSGPYRAYTAGVDTSGGPTVFPAPGDIENESDCPFLVPHWRGGYEIRLGSTFGIGDGCDDCYGDGGYGCGCNSGCDSCNTGCNSCNTCCCQPMYAWEMAWWDLGDERQEQYVDGPVPNPGTFRYYGMVNYAGLEYGGDPVNFLYNYQLPITDVPAFGDTTAARTVLSQRVTTNFSCQNLELNIMRLPLFTGGCGCDGCGPSFWLTGQCGVRYFQINDDLGFDTEWATASSGPGSTFDGWRNGTNELFHDINTENNLVGIQLGATTNYCVGSRWNFFWDSNFGVYNNYITQRQRMFNPISGYATFSQDGSDMNVHSNKDDVAFLGEMRLGGGYLFTQHWRGILAYRVIGVGGIAQAVDQIKPTYVNWADTARINSDGSMLIHGIQAGFEFNY